MLSFPFFNIKWILTLSVFSSILKYRYVNHNNVTMRENCVSTPYGSYSKPFILLVFQTYIGNHESHSSDIIKPWHTITLLSPD